MARRHHTGSGRRTVFPDDWQANHAAVITGTLSATVTIGDPEAATEVFNDTTGTTDVTPAGVLYTGPADIASISGSSVVEVAAELESTRSYQIVLPVDVAGIKSHHVVHVVDSPDPMLVGRNLGIDTTQLGDRRFSRVLHATLND